MMTARDTLSLSRFRTLAEAYGGCTTRWPEEIREEASRRARDPAFAEILTNEALLDDALELWTVPPPTSQLRQAIIARAPVRRPRHPVRPWLWWSGVGVAAALAGGGVGATAAGVLAPTQVVSSDLSTAFGDIGSQET